MEIVGSKYFKYDKPFQLESGEELDCLVIAYHTYGTLNEKGDNCIWVCHALTASSDVADWWPHTVVKDGFLDPDRYFIVCANILGSCYGSTGPMSVNPTTGKPYYSDFPLVTIRDVVQAHRLLKQHLGVKTLYSLIGASVGGFQALEWAAGYPQEIGSLVLIATEAEASPWAVAIDETQRMAIFADQSYGEPRQEAGAAGLATARALGLLTYRGPDGYNATQKNPPEFDALKGVKHRAQTYQRYQGEKLVKRFDAYSYVTILNMFDTHNIGRGRGGIDKVLSEMHIPALVVGISTDIIFTASYMRRLAEQLPCSIYREIDSPFGHDGFLVEYELLTEIIKEFFKNISC